MFCGFAVGFFIFCKIFGIGCYENTKRAQNQHSSVGGVSGRFVPAIFSRRVLRGAADFAGGRTPSFAEGGRRAHVLINARVCRELRAYYVSRLCFSKTKRPNSRGNSGKRKTSNMRPTTPQMSAPQRVRPEGYEPGWVAGICASCGGRLSGSYVGKENSSRLLQGTSNFALPSLLSTRTATAAGTPPCSFTMSIHS